MNKGKELIRKYVSEFNKYDNQRYINSIPNAEAAEWMENEIPYFECPDKDIEKTYYFRWWTFRKHIKKTEDGYVISEFLPNVPWAGRHNVINAASGHHISEGKWLKNSKKYLEDYINLLLTEQDGAECPDYSNWLVWALSEYCEISGDNRYISEMFDKIVRYVKRWENSHKLPNNMFWSVDDRDAMEYSVSGTDEKLNVLKGIRPTLNSYMYADYHALANIAKKAGRNDIFDEYIQKATELRDLINSKLWD